MSQMISELEPYILNEANMLNYLKYNTKNNCKMKNDNFFNETKLLKSTDNEEKNEKKHFLFIPKEHDSLFWCYYIILNGDVKYELLNVKNDIIAKQIKIEFISKIRDNKSTIRLYKFDTISNIESNLANDNTINIKTVMALCVIEKINIIFIKKNTYYELLMNDDKPIYVIREVVLKNNYTKKYGFEIADQTLIEEIKQQLYKIDNLDKPIKSLSAYKVSDLIEIANKLEIETTNKETGKNKTKNDLYEAIIQYF